MLKRENNGERKQLSMKDLSPESKGHFNFDLDEDDFEDFKCGYIPPNTGKRHAEVCEVVF